MGERQPLEHENIRIDALAVLWGGLADLKKVEFRDGDLEIIRALVSDRLREGAELTPRIWSKKYSQNRVFLMNLLGEETVVKLEDWSNKICPEEGTVKDKSTKKKGSRVPKFVQEVIRLASGEERMRRHIFVERTQQRIIYFEERERGLRKGETLNPSPISPEAVMLVLGWLKTGEMLTAKGAL